MKSKITPRFRQLYKQLPPEIRRRALKAYHLWKDNPNLRSLYFKRVNANIPIYSIRIGGDYRALGQLKDDQITWYWIGKHDEYDRLLK